VAPAQFVAVEYFDADGRRHRDVALDVGGEYWFARDGEAWTGDLRQAKPWLRDGIKAKLPLPEATRITDNVDVLPAVTA
jgi:hypothetical protein